MFNDTQELKGRILFTIYEKFSGRKAVIKNILAILSKKLHSKFVMKYGVARDIWAVENIMTSVGKAGMAGLLINVGSISAFTRLALGSSTTSPAVGQTALGSEITTDGLERAVGDTVDRITTSVADDTSRIIKMWTSSGSHTIEEIGIFNAASGPIMLSRALTTSKTIVSGETLLATYTVQFT